MTEISLHDLDAFSEAFVDERSHFLRLDPTGRNFIHSPESLKDQDIASHLEGNQCVAVYRADATKILAVELIGQAGRDSDSAVLRQFDRLRQIMPKPLVFGSRGNRTVSLYWLLSEAVPTDAAFRMLAHHFTGNGVKMDSCQLRPSTTAWLRLPLGMDNLLLNADTLNPEIDASQSVSRAVELIRREPRHRAGELLRLIESFRRSSDSRDSQTHGCRPKQVRPKTAGIHDSHQPNQIGAVPISGNLGLSEREAKALWIATRDLNGLKRYRHLEFLFSLIMEYKRAGEVELALPKSRLVKMAGAHSDNFNERLNHALAAGVLVRTNPKRQNRHPRRYRVAVPLDPTGHLMSLNECLRNEPLQFLSPHMLRKVKPEDHGLHGK
jgi:hypothetical protein